jgi:hypothetical protein
MHSLSLFLPLCLTLSGFKELTCFTMTVSLIFLNSALLLCSSLEGFTFREFLGWLPSWGGKANISLLRVLSPGMWRRVLRWKSSDVSEEHTASIFIVRMNSTCSSETPVDLQRATWRCILEDRIIHNHRCDNFKCYYHTVYIGSAPRFLHYVDMDSVADNSKVYSVSIFIEVSRLNIRVYTGFGSTDGGDG